VILVVFRIVRLARPRKGDRWRACVCGLELGGWELFGEGGVVYVCGLIPVEGWVVCVCVCVCVLGCVGEGLSFVDVGFDR